MRGSRCRFAVDAPNRATMKRASEPNYRYRCLSPDRAARHELFVQTLTLTPSVTRPIPRVETARRANATALATIPSSNSSPAQLKYSLRPTLHRHSIPPRRPYLHRLPLRQPATKARFLKATRLPRLLATHLPQLPPVPRTIRKLSTPLTLHLLLLLPPECIQVSPSTTACQWTLR